MFKNVPDLYDIDRPTIDVSEMESEMETEIVTAMVTKHTDMSYFLVPILCYGLSLQCAFICTRVNTSIFFHAQYVTH